MSLSLIIKPQSFFSKLQLLPLKFKIYGQYKIFLKCKAFNTKEDGGGVWWGGGFKFKVCILADTAIEMNRVVQGVM